MKKQRRNGSVRMWLLSLSFGIAAVVANPRPAEAQLAATISGRVEDASGGAVPAATVTVKSLETGATRVVTTDEVGNFRALALSVGRHEVKV